MRFPIIFNKINISIANGVTEAPDSRSLGNSEILWPRMVHKARPGRWAYDAVTYYWLEQALQKEFYVIKWSLGGTAIDTGCSSTSGKYWSADPKWLAANHSNDYRWENRFCSHLQRISQRA